MAVARCSAVGRSLNGLDVAMTGSFEAQPGTTGCWKKELTHHLLRGSPDH